MFRKMFYRISYVSLIAFVCFAITMNAGVKEGDFGISASLALPSGITASAAIPTTVLSQLSLSYGASTNLSYVPTGNLELDLGLGVVSISYSAPSGQTAAKSQTAISLMLGGKYFLSSKDVSPYLGAGFSYSSLPTITSGSTEVSGSLVTFIGFFGAQGFINASKNVALFAQIGFGVNSGSITTKVEGMSAKNGISTINLGGSAFGGSIYF